MRAAATFLAALVAVYAVLTLAGVFLYVLVGVL